MGDPLQQPAPLRLPHTLALLQELDDAAHDLGVGHLLLPHAHLPVAVEVAVLPEARRVVHHAHHPHERVVGDGVQRLRHVQGGQFAAKVQEMLAPKHARARQRVEVAHPVPEGLVAAHVETEIAEAERVQHRGHARRRALGVMREHGGTARPAGVGARLHLPFQVVRVDVHHAGNQMVAAEILRRGKAAPARLHLGDQSATQHGGAGHDGVGQHEQGVRQYGLDGAHAALRLASCRGLMVNSRPATRSREPGRVRIVVET